MITHLGVTATRKGLLLPQMGVAIKIFRALAPDLEAFHHGDCVGGDAELHQLMRKVADNVWIVGHLPEDSSQRAFCKCDAVTKPLPYIKRNHAIVEVSQLMLAFPGEYTMRLRGSGTWATIRWAQARKPLIIVFPHGKVATYNCLFPVIEQLKLPKLDGLYA